MKLNLTCTDAMTPDVGGSIACTVENGSGNYRFEWFNDGASALLELNAERSQAKNVPAGFYTVIVTDVHTTEVCTTNAEIRLATIQSVVDYTIEHASSDTARDGSIVAHLQNISSKRFLWTTGVITDTPQLFDVKPGTYTIAPLSTDELPVPFFHACNPAVVYSSRKDALSI